MKNKKTLLKQLNERMNVNKETFEEMLDYLSEKFEKMLEYYEDAQEAYNLLDFEIGGNVLTNNFVYLLSDGGEWNLVIMNVIPDTMLNLITKGNSRGEKLENLYSQLHKDILNTKCNVGCDSKTALSIILEEFPKEYEYEKYISIIVPDGSPRIELLENM